MDTVVPVLAGGLVGLVSLFVGRWLERRSSEDAWLHGERMRAYLSLLRASYDAWRAFEATYVAHRKGGPADEVWADLEAKVNVLSHSREEVALVGPQAVAEAAGAVGRTIFELAGHVRDADRVERCRAEHGSLPSWPAVHEYQHCHDRFVVEARRVVQHLG